MWQCRESEVHETESDNTHPVSMRGPVRRPVRIRNLGCQIDADVSRSAAPRTSVSRALSSAACLP